MAADQKNENKKSTFVLGITGGVGAGKSTVLDYLENRCGAFLIKCDDIAAQLQKKGQPCYAPMVELFGEECVAEDGELDRGKIAARVFQDPVLRKKLNRIVHPAVKAQVKELIAESTSALAVIEAALLLDDHYDEVCDEIWYVYADEETRRSRLKASRNYSDERIDHMFSSQRSDASFRELCDEVIDNSSDLLKNTYGQIDTALRERQLFV